MFRDQNIRTYEDHSSVDSNQPSRASDNSSEFLCFPSGSDIEVKDLLNENEEEWNDDFGFFENLKTQDAFHKNDDARELQCQGFISASKEPIPTSQKYLQNIIKSEPEKEIKISAKPQKDTNLILDADLGNIELSEWLEDDHIIKKTIPEPKTKFTGFQTTSNKKIESDAKFKAAKLFQNLPEIPEKETKAAKLFENLPEIPEKEIKLHTNNSFDTAAEQMNILSSSSKSKRKVNEATTPLKAQCRTLRLCRNRNIKK